LKTNTGNIVLSVQKAQDLFYHSVIPLSCSQLLHPDAEEYLVEEAEKKWQQNGGFQITIQIRGEESFNTDEIKAVIHTHFKSKHEKANHQVKKILRLGLRSLFVGFAFLVVMFLVTKALRALLPENAFMITLREFFIILGWVALWRPAELLLYEWRPYKRNANLFDRLATCNVLVIQ